MSGFSSHSGAWLKVRDVTVIRSGRLVLDAISFDLNRGETLVLTGPNGAGKSTLLRSLAGLCSPHSGSITCDDIPSSSPDHALSFAYLGHQDALKPGLTVTENLALSASIHGSSVSDALAQLDLSDCATLPTRLLSAGQKRRAALARVLLHNAPLWLLDEPSHGLDQSALTRLGHLIAAHRKKGGLIVITTHVPLPVDNPHHLTLNAPTREAKTWW